MAAAGAGPSYVSSEDFFIENSSHNDFLGREVKLSGRDAPLYAVTTNQAARESCLDCVASVFYANQARSLHFLRLRDSTTHRRDIKHCRAPPEEPCLLRTSSSRTLSL